MKLAILETGRPPGDLSDRFGTYPDMFERMLDGPFETTTFDVQSGKLPDDPSQFDGYMITGSPAGVYEPLPWIPPLFEFIRSTGERPMVGICFGHQAMAQALGGQVEKYSRGWSTGLHHYDIVYQEPWMNSAGTVAIPASHQDQVVIQPPGTRVVARSDFTPFAALAYTGRRAISFQFHPEFSPDFAKALIRARSDAFPEPERFIESLDQPNDTDRVGRWVSRFLKEDQ